MSTRPIRGPRGQHVYLRPLEPADAELVDRWYHDEPLRSVMGDLPISLARRRQRYEDAAKGADDTVLRFVICRLADDLPIGRADLFEIDRGHGSCAFGIAIGETSHRGHGFGSDAVHALVDFAFGELRMERVWLDTDPDNLRAQAVYTKAGFAVEGRLRHTFFQNGRFTDDIRMSLLRVEWLALDRPRSWDLVAAVAATGSDAE